MNTTGRKTVKAKASAPKSVKMTPNGPSFEEIAKRSYELYLARGGVSGHEIEDWLTAEAELSGRRVS
jgi:hypothetical protein